MAAGNFFGGAFFGGGFFGALVTNPNLYGPGWNLIFDQDQLAKFEAERANEGKRKETISKLFDKIYGRAGEAPADAPAPSVAREPADEIGAEISAREAAYQRKQSRELGIQIEMLNALKERAI